MSEAAQVRRRTTRPQSLTAAVQGGSFPKCPAEFHASRTQQLAWYFRKAAELYPLQVLPAKYAYRLLDGRMPASVDMKRFQSLVAGVRRELAKTKDSGLVREESGYRATIDADDYWKYVAMSSVERGRAGMARAQERVAQCSIEELNPENKRLAKGASRVFAELQQANVLGRLQLTAGTRTPPSGSNGPSSAR